MANIGTIVGEVSKMEKIAASQHTFLWGEDPEAHSKPKEHKAHSTRSKSLPTAEEARALAVRKEDDNKRFPGTNLKEFSYRQHGFRRA
jgi:hypothetical protein